MMSQLSNGHGEDWAVVQTFTSDFSNWMMNQLSKLPLPNVGKSDVNQGPCRERNMVGCRGAVHVAARDYTLWTLKIL